MISEWIKAYKDLPTTEDRRRAEICKTCEHVKESSFLKLIKGKIMDAWGLYCNLCGCPLIAKIKTNNKSHICKKWL